MVVRRWSCLFLFVGLQILRGGDCQPQKRNIYKRNYPSLIGQRENNKALECCINKETTIFSNQFGMRSEENFLCSPVVNNVESDDSYKIAIPTSLKRDYQTEIEKGDLHIFVHRARIEGDTVVGFSDSDIEVSDTPKPWKRELQRVGTRTILVLRVTVRDSEPELTGDEFRERIFGYDSLTVQSQYNKCSAGKLVFEPAPIRNGLLDVNIRNHFISDFNSSTALSNAAQSAAAELVGLPPGQHISSLADHVMICLPPGTGNWIAAAATNHWRSVYNNKFCGVISASMHELG
jgi:hypothetical protein